MLRKRTVLSTEKAGDHAEGTGLAGIVGFEGAEEADKAAG